MKNTKYLLGIVALAAALLSPAAMAQSGLYFGAGVGAANATDACKPGTPCGADGTAYAVFVGWQLYRALAVEVAARDLGTSQVLGVDFDSTAGDITLLAGIPIGPVFLFGKGGVYRGEVGSGAVHDVKVGVTFGGGVQVDLASSFALRAEWQRHRQMGATSIGFRSDIDTVIGSVVFKFR